MIVVIVAEMVIWWCTALIHESGHSDNSSPLVKQLHVGDNSTERPKTYKVRFATLTT